MKQRNCKSTKRFNENSNSMAPVLNTAKETLSGMDLPNIGEMGNLLKKLNGGAPDLKSLGKKPSKKDA